MGPIIMTVARLPRSIRRYLKRSCALLVAAGAVFTAACASTGATPRPFPCPAQPPGRGSRPRLLLPWPLRRRAMSRRPAPAVPLHFRPPVRRVLPLVDTYALTGTALALRGTRYRDGGTDPNGFDCSGFTQYVFGQHGIALPRNVKDQFESGKAGEAGRDRARRSDLLQHRGARSVSRRRSRSAANEFVHAPSSTGVVRVERLASTYWSQRFVGARRLN